jgi:hypothetical protein
VPTALTVTTTASSGVVKPALTAADATNNTFPNTGREWIEVNNAGGSPITVTLTTELTYQGFAIADQTGSVSNGTTRLFGPFDVNLYSPLTGNVTVAYSAVTSVTVGAFKLGTG